jgi:hypothetical protein
MANLYKSNKATVYSGNNCLTVYGDAAKIIEGIAIITVVLLAFAVLSKVL